MADHDLIVVGGGLSGGLPAAAYLQKAGFLAMGGVTSGEIRGQVQKPNERSPSYMAKLGVDRQLRLCGCCVRLGRCALAVPIALALRLSPRDSHQR